MLATSFCASAVVPTHVPLIWTWLARTSARPAFSGRGMNSSVHQAWRLSKHSFELCPVLTRHNKAIEFMSPADAPSGVAMQHKKPHEDVSATSNVAKVLVAHRLIKYRVELYLIGAPSSFCLVL